MDKVELLARTKISWDNLNVYVQSLSDEQQTQLTDVAGWTVKDHLIHLAVWEDGVWALLNKQNRPAQMGVDTAIWARWNFDEINAVIQQAHKDEPLAEVEQKRHVIHNRFIGQIEAMSEADLQRPARDFQTNSTSNTPVIEIAVGDTFSHYDEHLKWIRSIVENAKEYNEI